MRHDPEVLHAVNRYQLGLPRMPVAGRSGELMGRGTGSSLEFQEYREYMPGDDIRHLDWGAYARSDTLMVRLYREEISPRTEVYLDASRSMSTGDGAKARVAKQLAALFLQLSGRLGGRPQLYLLNDERPLRGQSMEILDALGDVPLNGLSALPDLLSEGLLPLKPQSVRIVISDFLFPHDPGPVIRRLAGNAGVLWVIQLLTDWETSPTELGGRKLIDVETAVEADLLVNRKAVTAYKERLLRLQEGLLRECRRVHAPMAVLTADRGLTTLCRDDLSVVGMLRAG
ncbi:MAG: DUF58 domain-containing protein [Planctomycetaceae bacterium]